MTNTDSDIGIRVLEDFHQLMIEALRQREHDIIQFVAILAAALAGFGWLAQASISSDETTILPDGVFVVGTAGVLFLLTVGAVYAVALGYNYRYITLQLAKIETKWCLSSSMLVKWPRSPVVFIGKYGSYCRPPEIIQMFWIAFLVAVAGVTVSAALLKPEEIVLSILIPMGIVLSLVGWLMPLRYGRKIKELASDEVEKGHWFAEAKECGELTSKEEKVNNDKNPNAGEIKDHKRTEQMFAAASFWWERHDRRVQVVWRVHFSLWTAFAALTGIIVTGRVPWDPVAVTWGCAVFSAALLVLHGLYIKGLSNMSRLDRDQFHHYYQKFQEEMKLEYPDDLNKKIQKAREKSVQFSQYANFYSLAVTFILAVALILASLVASNKWSILE